MRIKGAILTLIGLLLWGSVAQAQVFLTVPADPANYSLAFARSHWIPSLQSILYFYGDGSNPTGNNSLRLFKPSTGVWTTIYPNTNGATGPANRDNHNSLYVTQLDELWVWGGTFPSGGFVSSGRFKIGVCATSPPNNPGCLLGQDTGNQSAFASVVKNFNGGTSDTGWAWSEECNCGLGFGGGNNGNNRHWVVEPNTAGSPSCNSDGTGGQPYVMCEVTTGTRPTLFKEQCENCLVAVGPDFYLAGGSTDISTPHNDLWKFTTATRTWSQLTSAPVPYGYSSEASYDSDLNLVVVYGWASGSVPLVLAYDVARGVWGNLSYVAAGQQCSFNSTATYAPSIKKHVYAGGNQCPSGDGMPTGAHWAISLSGARLAGDLLLAPGLWVSRPLPPGIIDARNQFIGQTGIGPTPNGSGAKHQRFQYVPETGRVYSFSGDYNGGAPFTESFRNEIFSYNIGATDRATAADYQNWTVEHPQCGPGGGAITTGGSDETVFVWDSTRKIFWYVGGFEVHGDNLRAICAQSPFNISATFYGYTVAADHGPDILTFDPLGTRRWTRPAAEYKLPIVALATNDGLPVLGGEASTPRHGVYIPATDEIIVNNSGSGPYGTTFAHMNVKTGAWTRHTPAVDQCTAQVDNTTTANHEYLAYDGGSYAYFIDTYESTTPPGLQKMRRYNVTTGQLRNFGYVPLPYGATLPEPNYGNSQGNSSRTTFPYYAGPFDSHELYYDTVNNKLLWPATSNIGRPILMVFTPPTTPCGNDFSWSIDPMTRDRPTAVLFGSNGVYIPQLNAMMIYGGFGTGSGGEDFMCPGCDQNVPLSYFWLYRFGGTAQAQTDDIPPTVTITSPTANPTYATGTATIDLAGNCTDNVACATVTWVNDRGGSGSATGTTSWSITGIALQTGDNVITVTAQDAALNTSTDQITVTYSTVGDTTPPVVTITSPTSAATYSTASSTMSLGGTASDDVAVNFVTWANDRGGSGTATGTTTWSVATITLQSGVNVITVTVTDGSNNTATDVLTVTYTPPVPAPVIIKLSAANPWKIGAGATVKMGEK